MNKSITILGGKVDYAYIIRDVEVDKVTVEKYSAKCSSGIESAWEVAKGQTALPDNDEKVLEVVLEEKISDTTLKAKPNVIEIAARSGGKIIKDIVVKKTKKSVYLEDIIFFKDAT